MSTRQRIGELLVEAGVIDADQCREALEKQAGSGARLGAILLEMQALDEETLTRTLARQLSLPVVWLRGRRIRHEVLELVPAELVARNRCLPVQLDDRGTPTLLLAMEDPSDIAAIDEVAMHTRLAVKPVLAAPSELDDAIWRHRPSDPGDSLACAEFINADDPGPDLLSMRGMAPEDPRPAPQALPPAPGSGGEASPPSTANDLVLRAISQLLVEKGIVTRQELIDRLEMLRADDTDALSEG